MSHENGAWLTTCNTPIDNDGNLYHVFISYKSLNAGLARAVTEWLMSCGLRVWFAEYQILLHDRDKFQERIDGGTSRSQCAIALTNDDYIRSDHCTNELRALASTSGCDPRYLLEVALGTSALADAFLRSHNLQCLTMPHFFRGLRELQEWLTENLPFDKLFVPPLTPNSKTNPISGLSGAYRLDLMGWRVTAQEKGWLPNGVFEGPRFTFANEGVNLQGQLSVSSVRGLDRKSMQFGTELSNQRNYYNALIEFAKSHVSITDLKCVGVHLFCASQEVHFAITATCRNVWQRDYTLEMSDAYGNGIEFTLQFQFQGAFNEFCKYLPVMDSVAESLTFDSRLRYLTLIEISHAD